MCIPIRGVTMALCLLLALTACADTSTARIPEPSAVREGEVEPAADGGTPRGESEQAASSADVSYSDASLFYFDHLEECYRFTGNIDDLAGAEFVRWDYPGELYKSDDNGPNVITFDDAFDYINIIEVYRDEADREWAYLYIYRNRDGSRYEKNCWICLDDPDGSLFGGQSMPVALRQ